MFKKMKFWNFKVETDCVNEIKEVEDTLYVKRPKLYDIKKCDMPIEDLLFWMGAFEYKIEMEVLGTPNYDRWRERMNNIHYRIYKKVKDKVNNCYDPSYFDRPAQYVYLFTVSKYSHYIMKDEDGILSPLTSSEVYNNFKRN